MRFLWFGSAKDSTDEAAIEAKKSERLFRDSMRISRDIEEHLRDIGKRLPKDARVDTFRHLEGQLQLVQRHAERMREHLKNIDSHVTSMDTRLKHLQAAAQAHAAHEHHKAA